MATNQLSRRLDEIRTKFVSRLDGKFAETEAALPFLKEGDSNAIAAIAATYRRFHEICGTGRTLGYRQLGLAAGEAETILLEPYRKGRALTDQEVAMLRQALAVLRAAACVELQSAQTDRGIKS